MMTWANFGGEPGSNFSAFTPWKGHEMEGDFQAFEQDAYTLFNRDVQ